MSAKKIVLLSCASQKRDCAGRAGELYTSPLFTKSLKYAVSIKPDMIYILSAKYGLIDINHIIRPYNKTLNEMSVFERKKWSENVLIELKPRCDISSDEFNILAGRRYYEFLVGKDKIRNFRLPFGSMPIGKRLQLLKNKGF